MQLNSHLRRKPRQNAEGGYVLLALLLVVAVMTIAAGIIIPTITFQIKYDREQEMIHRGTQYTRAIRAYYKKFGRYPAKIEDLESSNNMRFLRKRYKDPLNCKPQCQDFKLLHFGEVQLTMSMGMVNPTQVGAGLNGVAGIPQAAGNGLGNSPSSFGQSASSFGQSNSGFGQSNSGLGNSTTAGGNNQNTSDTSNTDSGNPGTPAAGDQTAASNKQPGDQIAGQNFGGAPIIGVASATKITTPTYHEFNHKKKYKDWLFVYDPALDRGQLITTPYQPQLAMFGQQGAPNLNGQINGQGANGGAFGTGQPPAGMQNNPNLNSGGFGNSTQQQPSSPPQQQ